MTETILSLRGVTKEYPDARGKATQVLADLDLDVAEGEFVAIVGFSGSGKTTLVSAIAGLVELDAGEVLVRGQPSAGPGRDRGVVFQNYSLMPWMNVEGNVRLAVDSVHGHRSRAERRALTATAVELVGLGHATDRRTAQLSGGMRQRVAVARALAMEPEILLLDEPLSALDALTRAKLQDEIERIRSHEERTIVLVTNDVDEALLLADRVAVLERGPAAKISRVFDVPLQRPRARRELNHDAAYQSLRKEIVAYLDLVKDGSPAALDDVVDATAPRLVSIDRAPVDAGASNLDRPAPGPAVPGVLEISALRKVYPTRSGPLTIIEDFNLVVERGEFVALIGHSGCGKSTVLSMVAGLNEITSGRIVLSDRDVEEPGPDRAMVFQSPSLLPWLTARENVALGVDRVYAKAPASERREIVEYYLERVGLAAVMDKRASGLSNGMRQRVGLARAFALDPELLLLDEPFGMLDSLTRWSLQDVLIDVWNRSNVTTICVTHDVDEAILLADRIVMMTNGPNARIGRIMKVDLPRPRDRLALLGNSDFYAHREEVLEFLAGAV